MKPGRTTGRFCPCLAGNLELKDIAFALRDSADTGAGIEGSIKTLKLEHVRWFRLLKGEARAKRLLIRKPAAQVVLKPQAPEGQDSVSTPESFLKKVSLAELRMVMPPGGGDPVDFLLR